MEAYQNSRFATKLYTPAGATKVCVGYAAFNRMTALWATAIIPAGACTWAPLSVNWCTMLTPSVVLYHGVIGLAKVSSSVAHSSLSISCSSETRATLRLLSTPNTLAIGGGTTDIFVNDRPAGGIVDLKAGKTVFDISSTLNGMIPGIWEASAVMVLEPL